MNVVNIKDEQMFEPMRCTNYEKMVSERLLLIENENETQEFIDMKGGVVIVPDSKPVITIETLKNKMWKF